MTWWAEEPQSSLVRPGKARQRFRQTREDAREFVEIGPDNVYCVVRWPMSGWQVWRKVDKEWCEWVCDAIDRADATRLALQEAAERLKVP